MPSHSRSPESVPRVVVIGSGIGGLATALFLARRGVRVTVFGQEQRLPSGNLDSDFFGWERPRAPQAIQPHGLLGPVRTVLRAEAPDVYEHMLALGARERHELGWFRQRPPYRPGDEDLVTIEARRIVLETALADAVRRSGVDLRLGEAVSGLEINQGRQERTVPQVTGVISGSGRLGADLVIDAAGRRSPVPRWLTAAGCRSPVVERHRTGIGYFCRWYRLTSDRPSDRPPSVNGAVADGTVSGVFPSDNGIFGIALVVSTGDPQRGRLKDPDTFDRVARGFPHSSAWLAGRPEPLGTVRAMAGLENRWTSLVDEAGPIISGLICLGDAAVHTNPTLGQGAALALLAAQRVAGHLGGADDPTAFAADHHAWAHSRLRPWFDLQVAADRATHAKLRPPPDSSAETVRPSLHGLALAEAALVPSSLEDPVVMRARAQVRHLVLTPRQAYGTAEVRARLEAWLAAHPDFGRAREQRL